MCAASIFPMMALAQIVSILFLNVFFLFGGFFITYPNFPIWWKW
jgi:ABC-type multidrug transport system permease subunit